MTQDKKTQIRPSYKTIPDTLKTYSAIGLPTPSAIELKTKLLRDELEGNVAIVIFDALRCSSTLLASFSSGVVGAVIQEKGLESDGTSIQDALKIAKTFNAELIFGGELHGKPIHDGIVGNSPSFACNSPELTGKFLHFQSTNFGKAFGDMVKFSRSESFKSDIYVMSFLNCTATANRINSGDYEKIFVVCGSFFDCMSIEDMVLGGQLLFDLGLPIDKMDDDALAMYACYQSFGKNKVALERGWTARVLNELGKFEDVLDVLDSTRLPNHYVERMKKTILHVNHVDFVPILMNQL